MLDVFARVPCEWQTGIGPDQTKSINKQRAATDMLKHAGRRDLFE